VIAVHTSENQVPSLEYFKVQCLAMKNVAEYVIVCMSCDSKLFDCDGFLLSFC
jgi:hypothetical protein